MVMNDDHCWAAHGLNACLVRKALSSNTNRLVFIDCFFFWPMDIPFWEVVWLGRLSLRRPTFGWSFFPSSIFLQILGLNFYSWQYFVQWQCLCSCLDLAWIAFPLRGGCVLQISLKHRLVIFKFSQFLPLYQCTILSRPLQEGGKNALVSLLSMK